MQEKQEFQLLKMKRLETFMAHCKISKVGEEPMSVDGIEGKATVYRAVYTDPLDRRFPEEALIVEGFSHENRLVTVMIGSPNVSFAGALMAHFLRLYRRLAMFYLWEKDEEDGSQSAGVKALFIPNTDKSDLNNEEINDIIRNEHVQEGMKIRRIMTQNELEQMANLHFDVFLKDVPDQ